MSSRTVSTPHIFWAMVFNVYFCADMDGRMTPKKTKWDKIGSFFLVCWFVCLSLSLFVCLLVFGFSSFFFVFALLNHVFVRYCSLDCLFASFFCDFLRVCWHLFGSWILELHDCFLQGSNTSVLQTVTMKDEQMPLHFGASDEPMSAGLLRLPMSLCDGDEPRWMILDPRSMPAFGRSQSSAPFINPTTALL